MTFRNVSTESDAKITLNIETMFGEYSVLYLLWIWGGIEADLIIFDNNDFNHVELDNLIYEVHNSLLIND